MNLFINAVTQSGILILFDNHRQCIAEQHIEVLGNESSKLISHIETFLKNNKLDYGDLENIVVVNGPGSFTGVRTIVLAINTINHIINKHITALSFFDLFNKYPIVKSSSRRDLFVKFEKNTKIEIVLNQDFIEKLNSEKTLKVYGNIGENIFSEKITVIPDIDYSHIIKNIEFQKCTLIEPLYIKKPNIS